jgi:hypothetical protein
MHRVAAGHEISVRTKVKAWGEATERERQARPFHTADAVPPTATHFVVVGQYALVSPLVWAWSSCHMWPFHFSANEWPALRDPIDTQNAGPAIVQRIPCIGITPPSAGATALLAGSTADTHNPSLRPLKRSSG